jgi:site-specific DNA-methyltransferase (adenine-specific)
MTPIKKPYTLINKDCLKELDKIEKNSIDMIFSDPPYFLSNDGFSVQNGKMVSVNKGNWDKSKGFVNDFEFTETWIKKCMEVLKENGTIWISGTQHIIYQIGYILQKNGFLILNDISWFKPNGPPHLACRYFTHSHETILWAKKSKKSKHTFNYQLMKHWDMTNDAIKKEGKQMRSVWSIPLTPKLEKQFGRHPTQKPKELLRRIILSSTNKGDLILDPFCGSGTTGVVAVENERKFIGIEMEKSYIELSKKRINFEYLKLKKKIKENENEGVKFNINVSNNQTSLNAKNL